MEQNHGNPPRKAAIRAMIFLLLGAIVNVAVAWGCALWSGLDETDQKMLDAAAAAQILHRFDKAPEKFTKAVGYEAYSFGVLLRAVPNQLSFQGSTFSFTRVIEEVACGWPMLAMRCGAITQNGITSYVNAIHWPDDFRMSGNAVNVLPCEPITIGFSINTMFYTIIITMLSIVTSFTLRMLRLKRNVCPYCAYPKGTSPVCTECGRA